MFKRFLIFLLVFFLFVPAFIVSADLIIEPDNKFFLQHRNDCVYLGRNFYVNGEGGSASVKNEPGDGKGFDVIENGETVYIKYSCLYEGDYWGLFSNYSDKTSNFIYGWIQLDQLLVQYDYISFEEEHQKEFYQYNGDYAEIKKTNSAIIWPWPGADAPLWTVEDWDTDNFYVSHAYKDKDGREWGFVTYLYGSRNVWICLSDPLNRDIPVFNPAPEPTFWKSETVHTEIEKFANPTLWIIIGLVAVLVIGTAVLIKIFWKPNQNKL